MEAERKNGHLEEKLAILDEKYQTLASLEMELMDIKKKGNIITYEIAVNSESNENPFQKTSKSYNW